MTSHLQTCSTNSHLACLVSNPSNNDDLKTIRFLSDNGLLHFDLILSSQEQANEEHGGYDFLHPTRIYFEDFLHLFISYLAHNTATDSTWSSTFQIHDHHLHQDEDEDGEKDVLRPYLLRQAVGINQFTSGIDELNPSVLFSLGAQVVINSFKHGIGLNGFFDYLFDHQMLSLSSYAVTTILPTPPTPTPLSSSTPDTLLSSFTSLWNQLQQVASPTGAGSLSSEPQLDPNQKLLYISRNKETLLPPLLQEEYVTLGSDKALSYLNKFLRYAITPPPTHLLRHASIYRCWCVVRSV
jgi:hypothetical protein